MHIKYFHVYPHLKVGLVYKLFADTSEFDKQYPWAIQETLGKCWITTEEKDEYFKQLPLC